MPGAGAGMHEMVRGMADTASPHATRNLRSALAADDEAVSADPSCLLAWLQRGRTQVALRCFAEAAVRMHTRKQALTLLFAAWRVWAKQSDRPRPRRRASIRWWR
jgi:hypothetical protein